MSNEWIARDLLAKYKVLAVLQESAILNEKRCGTIVAVEMTFLRFVEMKILSVQNCKYLVRLES